MFLFPRTQVVHLLSAVVLFVVQSVEQQPPRFVRYSPAQFDRGKLAG